MHSNGTLLLDGPLDALHDAWCGYSLTVFELTVPDLYSVSFNLFSFVCAFLIYAGICAWSSS